MKCTTGMACLKTVKDRLTDSMFNWYAYKRKKLLLVVCLIAFVVSFFMLCHGMGLGLSLSLLLTLLASSNSFLVISFTFAEC